VCAEKSDDSLPEKNALCRIEHDFIVLHDGRYCIHLKNCSTENDIQEWVSHLRRKPWVTPQMTELFVSLARQHYGLSPGSPD
jgi:uncharacterized Fe-S cluster protein YjdI